MAKFKPRVLVDFDGVINSYRSGWKGDEVIPDPPVTGMREAIKSLREQGFEVVVCSSRAMTKPGHDAIHCYLKKNGIEVDGITSEKTPSVAIVDDRAICFDGDAEGLVDKVKNLKPWYAQEKKVPPAVPVKDLYDEDGEQIG